MEWFTGEVLLAIQKAINEKKVFIVFVKDDNEDSRVMEELWKHNQISLTCSTDKCVAINLSTDSVAGQQFSSIYPILSVPSTYLIDNQGIPVDIIPGLQEEAVFLQRVQDSIKKILEATKKSTDGENENCDQGEENNAAEPDVSLTSETTTAKRELLQEKRERLAKITAEKEKEKEKEEERKRREVGRELSQAQRDKAERQAKKLADEIAKQRVEEKLAREKVKEQIRLDRAEKAAKREADIKTQNELRKRKVDEQNEIAKSLKSDSNLSRLQFRLPDGSTVSNTFPADAAFSEVERFALERVKDTYPVIRLTTVYPKREYTKKDSETSLKDLGLVPNASIIVSVGLVQSSSSAASSLSFIRLFTLIFAPFIAMFNFILSLFTGGGSGSHTDKESSSSVTDSRLGQSPTSNSSIQSEEGASGAHRRVGGNINRLRRDDDDENATWNGNSTQQM